MKEKILATLNDISKYKAWRMIEKFRTHYYGKEFPGAKYLTHGVWFSFDQLDNWITDAKKDQCTGVRLYFATYLDKEEHPSRDTPEDTLIYGHRNTLVLIATKTVGNVERDQYKLVSPDKFNDPMNKGELCPEECGEEIP